VASGQIQWVEMLATLEAYAEQHFIHIGVVRATAANGLASG
jgi:hypothetical protein